MDIQVWSDIVCPWCYLGKRRLERAIAQVDGDVAVTYRAFQLDPAPVPEPVPLKEALAAKFGGMDQAEQMFAHVTKVVAADGLTLDFDRAVQSNTFAAHRLLVWAAGQGRQADLLEELQQAHFTRGTDLGSVPALAAAAGAIGLDAAAATAYLGSDAGTAAVDADIAAAAQLGITGVPFFVIDEKYSISGAQETATLLSAFEEIGRREG